MLPPVSRLFPWEHVLPTSIILTTSNSHGGAISHYQVCLTGILCILVAIRRPRCTRHPLFPSQLCSTKDVVQACI